ncbi:MAG: hydrogenase [Candidatus Riflebacteria bacterium]|nr:hydrogenase [Candidatus Riflebacteria bacterium]
MSGTCLLRNGRATTLGRVPRLAFDGFRARVLEAVGEGKRIAALFGLPAVAPGAGPLPVFAVLADDARGDLEVLSTEVGPRFQALTPDCPQAHLFERELAEQFGVVPEGHPWPRPVRFQPPLGGGRDGLPEAASRGTAGAGQSDPPLAGSPRGLPGVADFFRLEGEGVHEVAVGPVHAGVIEPGHFRFQCHGEDVFHLEISLGYQHRGIERALLGGPHPRTLFQVEAIAGDTTVGHTTAYAQIIETLRGWTVPPRAEALRAVGLELERLANHTGDLGALAGDVGFLPTSAFCGRIRGDFLNLSALLCGSRLGRGLVRPGGVGYDLDTEERLQKLITGLERGRADTRSAIQLLWETPGVMARFERTGTVSREACRALGLVGPAARACGAERDVRWNFPAGQYARSGVPPLPDPELRGGDVLARAVVRATEIENSLRFLLDLLARLPGGGVTGLAGGSGAAVGLETGTPLPPDMLAVSLVEGWRGEICHVAVTDARGTFARYKVVDPSFHNWIGLGMALRNQQISDFPLCNKSFNLSYCGFDL